MRGCVADRSSIRLSIGGESYTKLYQGVELGVTRGLRELLCTILLRSRMKGPRRQDGPPHADGTFFFHSVLEFLERVIGHIEADC